MAAVSGSIYKVETLFKKYDCLALYSGKGVDHTPPHNLVGKCAQLCRIEYGVKKLSKGISVVLLEKPFETAIGQTPLIHSFSRVVPVQTESTIDLEGRTYSIEEGELRGEEDNQYEFHPVPKLDKPKKPTKGKSGKKSKKKPEEEHGYLVRFNFEDRIYFRNPVPFATVRDELEWLRTKDEEGADMGLEINDELRGQIRKAARVDILHWSLKIKGYMRNEGWLF